MLFRSMLRFVVATLLLVICCGAVVNAADALDEVNKERAKHGLRAFKRDSNLTLAAEYACKYRSRNLIEGHCTRLHLSDFHFIPQYKSGPRIGQRVYNLGRLAAGCAAWHKFNGKYFWGSCCTYDTQYNYAGAWWEIGKDGRRYMHLFVRY